MTSRPPFIVPIQSHGDVDFLSRLLRALREVGREVVLLPANVRVAKTAQKEIPKRFLDLGHLKHTPVSNFTDLCEKYEIDSPRALVFPEQVYDRSYRSPAHYKYWLATANSRDYEWYRRILFRTLDYLDERYESGNGGLPIQNQGGEILRRTLQRVADVHGYTSVRFSFSPVPGQSLIRSGEPMEVPAIENADIENLTPERRKAAASFRASVVEDDKQVMGNSTGSGSLRGVVASNLRKAWQCRHDIIPLVSSWTRLRTAKRAKALLSRRFYLDEDQSRKFITSNKYVFYPIQYLRESRVTMRAPEFYNQIWLIEYLSRSLPAGYELVVKDHPQQLGALPLSHVRALQKYATAVDPSVPGRQVVKHADAIVTLNNTVGYEAVMAGKPVVTLGDAFYSSAGYTRDVSQVNQLPSTIEDAVTSNGLTDSETLEFAAGVLDASHPGEWGQINTENIESISSSILEFSDTGA